jgi:hypothetical protein
MHLVKQCAEQSLVPHVDGCIPYSQLITSYVELARKREHAGIWCAEVSQLLCLSCSRSWFDFNETLIHVVFAGASHAQNSYALVHISVLFCPQPGETSAGTTGS